MKSFCFKAIYLFLGLLLTHAAGAQTTVTGTVFSAGNRTPLEGASVVVKGQNIQTVSSEKGAFSFPAARLPLTVTVSYAGYEARDFTITASPITISLNRREQSMDEVVVTGYSTQSQKITRYRPRAARRKARIMWALVT